MHEYLRLSLFLIKNITRYGMKKKLVVYLFLIFFFLCNYLKAEKVELVKKYEFGSDEKEEEIFFRVIDIKVDPDGNIFILDSGNNCIKKFSRHYKFLGETGKQGQGPGEMMNPLGLAIDTKGNVYLNDLGNRRINIYDSNLRFLKSIKLEKQLSFSWMSFDREDNLILLATPTVVGSKYFYKFSAEGKLISSFWEIFHSYAPRFKSEEEWLRSARKSANFIFYFMARAAINHKKSLISFTHLIPENPYKVYILNETGDILKTLGKRIDQYSPEKQKEWEKGAIIIYGLHFAKEDYLIVQRRYDYGKDSFKFDFLADIFTPMGNLIVEDLRTERIISIDGENNIYTVREEEKGIVKIIVYRLEINKS